MKSALFTIVYARLDPFDLGKRFSTGAESQRLASTQPTAGGSNMTSPRFVTIVVLINESQDKIYANSHRSWNFVTFGQTSRQLPLRFGFSCLLLSSFAAKRVPTIASRVLIHGSERSLCDREYTQYQ